MHRQPQAARNRVHRHNATIHMTCDMQRGDLDQREWEQPRRVNTRRRGLVQACTAQAMQRPGHHRLRTQCRLSRGQVGVAHVRVAEDVGEDEGVEVEDGPMWTWAVCGR